MIFVDRCLITGIFATLLAFIGQFPFARDHFLKAHHYVYAIFDLPNPKILLEAGNSAWFRRFSCFTLCWVTSPNSMLHLPAHFLANGIPSPPMDDVEISTTISWPGKMGWILPALIVLVACLVLSTHCCKIKVRIHSRTDKPFQFELHVTHRNLHVEPWLFTKQWEQRKVLIKNEQCFGAPWIIRVNKLQGDRFVEQKNLTAQLDGEGFIRVEVGDDYQPWLNDRHGVFCAHGECEK